MPAWSIPPHFVSLLFTLDWRCLPHGIPLANQTIGTEGIQEEISLRVWEPDGCEYDGQPI
jgi:hypothetical protein